MGYWFKVAGKWGEYEKVASQVDSLVMPFTKDEPILVRDSKNQDWMPRHFARVNGMAVEAWQRGKTSFTAKNIDDTTYWRYFKKAEA